MYLIERDDLEEVAAAPLQPLVVLEDICRATSKTSYLLRLVLRTTIYGTS